MDSVFSFVVGLLTAALSLLGFVQQHPELPQASKDQAQQIAQQAITTATVMLAQQSKTPVIIDTYTPKYIPIPALTSDGTASYIKQHGLLLITETDPHEPNITKGSIYKVRADGSGKTLLTASGAMPSWTPNGDVIFVSNRSGSPQVWIMKDDGSSARQIGQLEQSVMVPVMPQESRNGLIVFMAVTPFGAQSIWKMQSNGSGLKQLVGSDMIPSQPSLALSGTWITFTSETNNPYHREIWRINADGTGLRQLTFLGDPNYHRAK